MSDVIGLNLNPEANNPECEIDEKVVQGQQCDRLDLTKARCEAQAPFPVIDVFLELFFLYLDINIIILEFYSLIFNNGLISRN